MPDFNIVYSFTERLNIFNYIENMDEGQNIPLNIAFRCIIDDNNKMENRLLSLLGIYLRICQILKTNHKLFRVYAVTLSEQERMDSKKQRINRCVPKSIGVIDEVHCIARENLIDFS